MNNIVSAVPTDQIYFIHETFNSLHNRLKFTTEYEKNHNINFPFFINGGKKYNNCGLVSKKLIQVDISLTCLATFGVMK